jgi:hypothetical protein
MNENDEIFQTIIESFELSCINGNIKLAKLLFNRYEDIREYYIDLIIQNNHNLILKLFDNHQYKIIKWLLNDLSYTQKELCIIKEKLSYNNLNINNII